jgi:hypothetical protein
MQTLHRVALACTSLLIVVACGKSDQAATDSAKSAAGATPAPAPAPAVTLADFAGKWNVTATPLEGKDTSVTKYVLTATADTSGWMIEFATGVKATMSAMLSGDSVTLKTAQFSSQRRKNVKVWTEGAVRIQGGNLTGTTTAHYAGAGADSILHLRVEGTKAP